MTTYSRALMLILLSALAFTSQAAYVGILGEGYHSAYNWNAPGNFSGHWDFQVAQDSNVAIRITDVEKKLKLFGLTVTLLDNRRLVGQLGSDLVAAGDWFTTFLQAGVDYTLSVTGKAVGTLGGKYLLEANVAPVPLPAALPLFLVALLGMFALRFRNPLVQQRIA